MSQSLASSQGVKRVTLNAKIVRADGGVEELGPVAEYHAEPQKQSKLLGGIEILNFPLFQKYCLGNPKWQT